MVIEESKSLTVIEIRIKLLRNIKGLTQKNLAQNIGVSQALINSWENGYQNISLRGLIKLSYFYKVPIDYMMGLTTEYDKTIYNYQKDLNLTYLGQKIKIIRKIEELTQEEFASILHTKRSNISYYEHGKMTISSSDLKEICNDFGFSADWCIGNTNKCIRRTPKITLAESEYKIFTEI